MSIYPAWDRVEPIEDYKFRRDRDLRKAYLDSLPMMKATDAEGRPLYRHNGHTWHRTQPLSRARRRKVIERDGHKCVWCGSLAELEVDHIIRYVDGGSNEMNNLRTLCGPCHRSRGGAA